MNHANEVDYLIYLKPYFSPNQSVDASDPSQNPNRLGFLFLFLFFNVDTDKLILQFIWKCKGTDGEQPR